MNVCPTPFYTPLCLCTVQELETVRMSCDVVFADHKELGMFFQGSTACML